MERREEKDKERVFFFIKIKIKKPVSKVDSNVLRAS